MITKEIQFMHYAPSRERFFNGGDGYNVKNEVTRLFGIKIRTKELDRERVPHFHYVQERTLGVSEFRTKFFDEIQAQKALEGK